MASCDCSKISATDTLVLGAIQILIGSFHTLMWYFLLDLYMGQVKGVFGTYEPVTYKAGCALWGVVFIISGAFLIKVAKNPTPRLVTYTLILNIICIITAFTAICMILHELSDFDSVSYRNYGQAKLGREASRILLASNNLELAIALTYTIFIFINLAGGSEENAESIATEQAESSL